MSVAAPPAGVKMTVCHMEGKKKKHTSVVLMALWPVRAIQP